MVEQDCWRSITTAPKDGTIIDVWLGDVDESDRSFYCNDNTRRSTGWCWSEGKFRPFIPGMVLTTFVEPTHWMPLPNPPADAE